MVDQIDENEHFWKTSMECLLLNPFIFKLFYHLVLFSERSQIMSISNPFSQPI